MRKPTVVRHPSSKTGNRRLMGAWIQEKRFDLGYTRADVVSRLWRPRSQGWLQRYESGAFHYLMPLEELRDLCEILRINPAEVLLTCGFFDLREVELLFAEREGQKASIDKRRRVG